MTIPCTIPVIKLPKSILKPLAVCFLFLCTAVVTLCAQDGSMPPAGPQAGSPAGGKWKEFRSEDKMTAAQKVRFELEADSLLPDSEAKAKVLLFCVNGKVGTRRFPSQPENRSSELGEFLGKTANERARPRGQFQQPSSLELGERQVSRHGQRHRPSIDWRPDIQSRIRDPERAADRGIFSRGPGPGFGSQRLQTETAEALIKQGGRLQPARRYEPSNPRTI
jgi:hypothetical protein